MSFRVTNDYVAQPFQGSWPVLVKGSWSDLNNDLWAGAKNLTGLGEDEAARKRALRNADLTEEDFWVLNAEIDKVNLPNLNMVECMLTISQQLNPALNPDAHTVDVNALADTLIQTLQIQISEG